MTTKYERQGAILRLVQQQPLSTQSEVAGTIAGDNTIFVAAREGMKGGDVRDLFRHYLDGDES